MFELNINVSPISGAACQLWSHILTISLPLAWYGVVFSIGFSFIKNLSPQRWNKRGIISHSIGGGELVKRAWALDQRNLVSFLSVLLDVWLWVSYGKLIGPLFPSLWSRDHNTCDPEIILGYKRGNLREITLKLSEASEPCTWNSICLRCSSGALLPLYWQIPPYLSEPCLCIISLHVPPLMTYCSSPISVLSAYNRKGVLGYILSVHKLHTE